MSVGMGSGRPRVRSFANAFQVYDFAVAGALGALCGLFLYVELPHARSVYWRDAMAGVAIGGTIGFALAATLPFRDGAWSRLVRSATCGMLAGALGGSAGLVLGELVIGWFQGGLVGRSAGWAVLGLGIGISQALADWSRTRLLYGVLGGTLGGWVGGFLFEWLRMELGNRYALAQALGIVVLGAGLGACLSLVEQVLRRAWVQVLNGRQEGRFFLLARRVSAMGLDEHAPIGLFGDPTVARRHAEIEAAASTFVLTSHVATGRTKVNGAIVDRPLTLRDGDRIELGQTVLLFRQR